MQLIKSTPDEANLQDLETFISTAIANIQKDMEALKKELTERNGRKRVREEDPTGSLSHKRQRLTRPDPLTLQLKGAIP